MHVPENQTRGWLARNPSPSALEIVGLFSPARGGERVLSLPLDRVRPMIHLAHRLSGPHEVRSRIVLDHELLLILQGNGEIQVRDVVQPFCAGDLFLIAPFVPHRFLSCSPSFEHVAIHFRLAPELPRLGELHAQPPYRVSFSDGHELRPHVHLDPTASLRTSLEQVIRLWAVNTPIATLNAEALLMNVVAQLLRPSPLEQPSSDTIDHRIADAIRQIELRSERPPRIAELAAAANLGPTQFNLLFREHMNETPAAYVRRCRTRRARELLEHTDLPVKAIALANGFRDAAHFSRTFFKLCGKWPTEHRKAARACYGSSTKPTRSL
jgi:AraC-like DNA-binding protein